MSIPLPTPTKPDLTPVLADILPSRNVAGIGIPSHSECAANRLDPGTRAVPGPGPFSVMTEVQSGGGARRPRLRTPASQVYWTPPGALHGSADQIRSKVHFFCRRTGFGDRRRGRRSALPV